ncbi:MAG: ABC transporter permease [Dehalococcoidia bacterium]|nr:ABC transporter permease [Dehalococcoidia bacterium]
MLLLSLIVAWEVIVRAMDVRPYIMPAPSRIWDAFLRTRGTLPDHTWTTLQEAIVGIVIGAAIGVVIASLLASVPLVRRVLYPPLIVSQVIPMIVLAPLLVIWFGLGMTPKVVVVALITVFPVVISTADALLSADQDLIALVRSMGANRLQVLWHVLIPSAIPAFFAGLKIAATYAIAGAVIAEWVGASQGLGIYINRSTAAFQTDQVFVAVVIIAALSMALFAVVQILSRLAAPWMYLREGNR